MTWTPDLNFSITCLGQDKKSLSSANHVSESRSVKKQQLLTKEERLVVVLEGQVNIGCYSFEQ